MGVGWDTAVELFPKVAVKLLKHCRWETRNPELSARDLGWEFAWRERPLLRDLERPHGDRTEQRALAVVWVALVCLDAKREVEVFQEVRVDYPPDPVCDAIQDQEADLG